MATQTCSGVHFGAVGFFEPRIWFNCFLSVKFFVSLKGVRIIHGDVVLKSPKSVSDQKESNRTIPFGCENRQDDRQNAPMFYRSSAIFPATSIKRTPDGLYLGLNEDSQSLQLA